MESVHYDMVLMKNHAYISKRFSFAYFHGFTEYRFSLEAVKCCMAFEIKAEAFELAFLNLWNLVLRMDSCDLTSFLFQFFISKSGRIMNNKWKVWKTIRIRSRKMALPNKNHVVMFNMKVCSWNLQWKYVVEICSLQSIGV